MHEKSVYEYAVVRIVPRVEREEFVNVGLLMMCKRRRRLEMRMKIDMTKLAAMAPATDLDDAIRQLHGFERICRGESAAGPIAQYPVEERFRWLTAAKSACVQTSRPHPGLTTDFDNTFDRLFAELVD